LNILFLAQRVPYPPNKGEKIRTFNQLKYLTELGYNITVCAPIENDSDSSNFIELQQKYGCNTVFAKLQPKPLRLITGLIQNKALSVANFYNKALQKQFDTQLAENLFDAIICTSSAMAEYIYNSNVIGRLNNKPKLIMDFMDLDSDKWQQYASSSTWPMSWIYKREAKLLAHYERNIVSTFDCSFFIADAEVNLFLAQSPNLGKVLTMGNGMDTELFSPAPAPTNNDAPVFVFTGVMDYKPNIDAVVWFTTEIWPELLNKYPKAKFIIAGMNPTPQIQRLADINGITVTGFVDDILPYYHQADYFVAPFRLARGVQNKVLQAFACGLPVISTPMGAEGIDCVDGESILIASSPTDFVSCVERLEADKNLRQSIKANALALINNEYSWPSKLNVLINELNA
jgi:sugar transferase (PEP-CTERM/EpsH1 system associated)